MTLLIVLGVLIGLGLGGGFVAIGATRHPVDVRFICLGIWAFVSTLIALGSGAIFEPQFTSEDTFGVAVSKIKDAAWWIIAALFVVVIIVCIVVGIR